MKLKRSLFSLFAMLFVVTFVCGCSDKSEPNADKKETETTTVTTEKTIWEKKYYVDDFDMETDEWYVANKDAFSGKFSNSATTDSLLYAYIIADATDVSIMLYEYGRSQVKNSFSRYNEDYNITMLLDDKSKVDVKGSIYTSGDRIVISAANKDKVLNALKTNKNITFRIVQANREIDTYIFTAETSNFASLYTK